ncbi:hypothetical protein HDV57DRAFT_524174 [Trichoderma longibrachiatum]|uniref:Uncharacterized protein n=1 Tax=Trichoderma longibrachiatum ATCC 18648 TaxID=983965 RepID=A0A2T4C9N4_TRILO|nr:hypothetical protein M440DRAFT_1429315 [Trichoderma longibrachiatum ATCC 18648]
MLNHNKIVFGLVAAGTSLVAAFPASSSAIEGSMTTYIAPPAVTETSPFFPGDGVEGSMTTLIQTIIPTTSVTGSMTTMLTTTAPTAAPSVKAAYRDRLGDLIRDWLDQLEDAVGAGDHLKAKKRAVEARQTADPMPTFTPDPPTHTADPMPTFTPDPPTHTADPMPTFTPDPPTHTADPMPTFTPDPPTHTADPMPTFTPDPPALNPDPMPTIKPDPTKPPRYAATPSPVLFGLPEWWPLFVANATQSVASRTSASPSAGLPTNTLPPSTGAAQKTAAPLVGAVVAAAGAYYLL